MKKNTKDGFTSIQFLIVVVLTGLIWLLAVPPFFDRTKKNRQMLERCQTALTYGLANGLQPISLQDGLYYFHELSDSNLISSIMSFTTAMRAKSNHLNLTLVCRASRGDAITKKIDWRLAKLAEKTGLTNGHFVLFQEMKEDQPRPPVE